MSRVKLSPTDITSSKIEKLCRYIARPAVALERLRISVRRPAVTDKISRTTYPDTGVDGALTQELVDHGGMSSAEAKAEVKKMICKTLTN